MAEVFAGAEGRIVKETVIDLARWQLEQTGVVRWDERIDPERGRFPEIRVISSFVEKAMQAAGLSRNTYLMVLLNQGQELGNCYLDTDYISDCAMQLSVGGVTKQPLILPIPRRDRDGAYMDTSKLSYEERRILGHPNPANLRIGGRFNNELWGVAMIATTPDGLTIFTHAEVDLWEDPVKSIVLREIAQDDKTPADRIEEVTGSENSGNGSHPDADTEEAWLLKLLKEDPKEAFKMMRAEAERFPDLVSKRNTLWTKLAKFGSVGTTVKIQLPCDALTIILPGLNTTELIKQSSTGQLHFSKVEKCLTKFDSTESLELKIDGSEAGNYGIRARIVRIDVGTLQYTDAIPYLRSQIREEQRMNYAFSESTLRSFLANKLGTPEALAYIFSQLRASEELQSSIGPVSREGYLKVYAGKPEVLRHVRVIDRKPRPTPEGSWFWED